jgi:flap endonuclease-1
MGVNLTPIILKEVLSLEDLEGRSLAVDAPGEIHGFLALIRLPDGTPLRDSRGRTTSHLSGLFYRTTRLAGRHRMKLVFVFDGRPPELKGGEIARRREVKERYEREYREALAAGELSRAWSKATRTSRLSSRVLEDCRRLLDLLGVPWIEAPGEAEAQAAAMAARGEVWGAASRDYDCLLFGAPRQVRFLTISGRQLLPRRGISRPLRPELIVREELLRELGLRPEQLIDLAILVGTDFNPGVKGIGPRRALALLRRHGRIEELPEEVRARLPPDWPAVREIYLHPPLKRGYELRWGRPDREGLEEFLCGERDFSLQRVRAALKRMEEGLAKG